MAETGSIPGMGDAPLPLTGLKVLEISQGVAGPFCAMVLGDLGADVIKVEKPGSGDLSRGWGPPFASPGNSAYYLSVNRNKRSIVLDLRDRSDRDVFDRLVAWSDVFVDNSRPGALERLGLSDRRLQQLRPGLIRASVTGYGRDGPSRVDPSFDFAIQARSGLMSLTGTPGAPMRTPVAFFDLVAGLYSVIGILLELRKRDSGERPAPVDVNLLDTATSLLGYWLTGYSLTHETPAPTGAGHPLIVPYQLLPTRDGFIALAVGTDEQFRQLCQALGQEGLSADARFRTNSDRVQHRAELIERLEPLLRQESTHDLVQRLSAAGVPCGPFQTIPEVLADAQVRHNASVVPMKSPGGREVSVGGIPLERVRRGEVVHRPAPDLGEHSEEILTELGYSPEEVSALRGDSRRRARHR